MFVPGDIVACPQGEGFSVVVSGTAERLHLVRIHSGEAVAPDILPLTADSLVSRRDCAQSLPAGAAIHTWESCVRPACDLRATGMRLTRSALDGLLRTLGRDVARTHYEAIHAPQPFVPGKSGAGLRQMLGP